MISLLNTGTVTPLGGKLQEALLYNYRAMRLEVMISRQSPVLRVTSWSVA